MPKSIGSDMQAMFEADPLNSQCANSDSGRETLNMFADISATAHQITIPFLIAYGEFDIVVNPEGLRRLYEAISSQDKTCIPFFPGGGTIFFQKRAGTCLEYIF